MNDEPEKPKGDWLARSRAWLSILLLVPFAAVALFSTPFIAEDSPADFALDALAWLTFMAGGAFRWWATLYIGGRKHRELVVDGPYSMCRNPLYFGTVLLSLSIALFLHSLLFLVGLLLATAFYLLITVPVEESNLEKIYGNDFVAFCGRVPQFFPNPWLFHTEEVIPVRADGLLAEAWRTLAWMWIPLLAQAVAHLRTEPYWPHLLFVP